MSCIDCIYEARCLALSEESMTYCEAHKKASAECEPEIVTQTDAE